mmetsp:Transcript_19582/g.41009  ORF Transcript_19582/g.41009 Transcript_19582/m.41009 type:complete len:1565 (+) Transcript_19582:380-5074(+)
MVGSGLLLEGSVKIFLWKMISFDYHDLPQVASNALSDMVCITAMGACGYNLTQLQHRPNDVQNNAHEFKISVSQPSQDILRDQMIRKLFVTCLLSANFRLRSMAVVIFGTEQNEVKVACDSLESICARDVLTGNNSISGRSPFDILRQLLSADYEGLGKRLWTTIFAEILLACSDHSDGAYLACKQSEHQLFEPREKSKTVKRARGFLRPTQYQASKQQVLHTNRNNDYILNTTYSTFQKAILTERARKRFGRGRCLIAMRTLIHGCVDTCQLIFCCVLKAAWQNIPTNERRASLIKPMESLLSRPYHAQFLKIRENSRINAIQSILGVILHLRPLPSLDVFLIRSLASNYSCQREVLSYFEQHFTVLKRNGLEVNISSSELIQSILHVYKTLGDDDMIVSINSSLSTFKGTKFALSLDMYGFVIKSTDAYLALIDRVDGARKDFAPPEFELSVWEDRWVKGYKELSQWHLIDEFAASHGDPELMMECAWKVKNWDKVKSLCASPSVIASLVDGDPVTKMSEIFLAIHEGKLSEVENLHAQTAQLCLHKWQLLPSIGTDSNPHKVLLQQFQRLVELRESSQVMVETSSHSSGRTIPDLKNLLSSWRHRVPNSFEPISVWEDLFLWRQQIFDAVTSNFSWSEPGTLATLHDRPWTCISLCRTARKHGLKEVSMLSLSNLTECAMDVQDAFLKLREQVFTYRNATASHLKGGLNVVNSTNLSFFDARQKAELFRLKGFFLDALNDKTSSNQAYCNSVQICPTYSKAWVDWGNLCASLFVITRKKADNQPDAKLESTKKSNQYLAQAMGCFLEAVRCDASEHSRDRIPHCLSMISNDGAQYGILCQTLEARGVLLPAWVWLPWIPQLLTSLCRIEARAVKSIIGEVVKDHPQAVYYSLRAFFLERRDVDRSRGQDADSKDEESLLSVKYAELLMSNLRKLHPILWSKLEVILEDLIIRFRPSYEAELLATITALLQKASSRVELKSSKEEKNKEEHSLLESYHTTLKRIGMKFFNKEKPDGSKSRKAVLFHAKYASMFECDFLRQQTGPNGAVYSGPASIPELVERLKRWKLMIEYQVSRVPSSCKLQEASPSLAWYSCEPPDLWAGACESKSFTISKSLNEYFPARGNELCQVSQSSALVAAKTSSHAVMMAANSEGLGGHAGGGAGVVEIPGQYAPTSSGMLDIRPFPELHAKLIRFEPTLEVVTNSTKQEQIVRRISMLGSNGRQYKFLLQLAIPYWTRTDERSAQLHYIMGKVLRKDIRSCKRCVTVKPKVVIPVAQRMRMSSNETSHQSLENVFHKIQGPSSNQLISHFQETVNDRLREMKGTDDATKAKVKLEVYQEICNEVVLPNFFTRYMTEMIKDADHLFQFRKVFTSQLAANSLLQHAFALVERTPVRFVFCTKTGQMISQDFRFQYNQGLLDKHKVPFRLTRNIEELIGPFLLQGVFIPSFVSISSAMNDKRSIFEPMLHILLRDDIISWYTSKSNPRNDHKSRELEVQLSDRIWKNVGYVQERVEECSARLVEDASKEAISENPDPVDSKVRQLISVATNSDNLSLMSATFQAWL